MCHWLNRNQWGKVRLREFSAVAWGSVKIYGSWICVWVSALNAQECCKEVLVGSRGTFKSTKESLKGWHQKYFSCLKLTQTPTTIKPETRPAWSKDAIHDVVKMSMSWFQNILLSILLNWWTFKICMRKQTQAQLILHAFYSCVAKLVARKFIFDWL